MSENFPSAKKKQWRWIIGVGVVCLFVLWGPSMTASKMCKEYADSVTVQIGNDLFKVPTKDVVAIFNDRVLVKYMQCSDNPQIIAATNMQLDAPLGQLSNTSEFVVGISSFHSDDLDKRNKKLISQALSQKNILLAEDGFYKIDDFSFVEIEKPSGLRLVLHCSIRGKDAERLCRTGFYVDNLYVGVEQTHGQVTLHAWKEITQNAIAFVEQLKVKTSLSE